MEKILKYIKIFFEKLSSKPRIDGIEIEDNFVKYAYFDGLEIKTSIIKIPPGVIEEGKLKDKKIFVNLLKTLATTVKGNNKKREVLRANVLLPSSLIFTQLFTIPVVPAEELESAVELNLRMISPFSEEEGNKSAQILSTDGLNYELLAAFASKKEIFTYQEALMEAGIIPVSFEFASLALARFLRKYINLPSDIILVLEISSAGLDLSVLKNRQLVFNYFKSWHYSGEGVISERDFENIVASEVKRVFDFVYSKFNTPPQRVLLIAPGLEERVSYVIYNNFNIHPEPIEVSGMEKKTGFYSVIGGALSWEENRPSKNPFNFINLGGENLAKSILEEQIINFTVVWRGIFAVVFGFLLVIYFWGNIFVARQYSTLEERIKNFNPPLDQKKLADLESKANLFNTSVAELNKAVKDRKDFYSTFKLFSEILSKNRVVLKSINFSSGETSVNIIAQAPSYDTVFRFKDNLEKEGKFKDVELPISQIMTNADNSVSFFLSFRIN